MARIQHFIIALVLLTAANLTTAALNYDVSTLDTFKISELKAKTIKAGTDPELNNLRLECVRFAVGVLEQLDIKDDIGRKDLPVDAIELFSKLEQWISNGPKISDSYKATFVPIFKSCSEELGNESIIVTAPPEVIEPDPIPVELVPENNWDFNKLQSFHFSSALSASKNLNGFQQCKTFADRVFIALGETHDPRDPKLVTLSLEMLVKLQKHISEVKKPTSAVVSAGGLAKKCGSILTKKLKE